MTLVGQRSMFRIQASMCFMLALLVVSASIQAEVVIIEGTIKSVDAKKHTITVATGSKTLTLDVSSRAKIAVDRKTASLESVKPGQKFSLVYHDKLEVVLKIDARTGSLTQGEPQFAFRSVEIAIDENGASSLTVDSRSGTSTRADEKGRVIDAGNEDRPEIVRLSNGNRRIDYDFGHLRSVEALLPLKCPDKSLLARMRGQVSMDKEVGAFQLSPVRADGRVAFDLPSPMNTQLPLRLKAYFARFDQGRFNFVLRFPGTSSTLDVALDQRYQSDDLGIVRVEWRDGRPRHENQPVHLERSDGWKSLLRYTQDKERLTGHRFRIPPVSFRKLGSQKQATIFWGVLGEQPILIRRLELVGTSFTEAFGESK